jgi:hypothetical protein
LGLATLGILHSPHVETLQATIGCHRQGIFFTSVTIPQIAESKMGYLR